MGWFCPYEHCAECSTDMHGQPPFLHHGMTAISQNPKTKVRKRLGIRAMVSEEAVKLKWHSNR